MDRPIKKAAAESESRATFCIDFEENVTRCQLVHEIRAADAAGNGNTGRFRNGASD